MVTQISVSILSGNGLLPGGTKPLPDHSFICSPGHSLVHMIAISQLVPLNWTRDTCYDIILSRPLPHKSIAITVFVL